MRFSNFEIIFDDFQIFKTAITILPSSEFPLRTKNEIQEIKLALIDTIKLDTSFKLLTRFESFLRLDIDRSLKSRTRDPISQLYKETVRNKFQSKRGKSFQKQARFLTIEEVLNALRDYFLQQNDSFQAICSRTINFFEFRHWYAHGRYFRISQRIPDPDEIFEIGLIFNEKILQCGRKSFSKV